MRMRVQVIAMVAVLASAACGGGGDSTSPVTPTGGGAGAGGGGGGGVSGPISTNSVTVGNNNFSPNDIQVSPGTTVTWTWASTASTHNVTFGDGTSSGDKGANSTFSRTFATAGTFSYQCTLHGGMTGSVTVK